MIQKAYPDLADTALESKYFEKYPDEEKSKYSIHTLRLYRFTQDEIKRWKQKIVEYRVIWDQAWKRADKDPLNLSTLRHTQVMHGMKWQTN